MYSKLSMCIAAHPSIGKSQITRPFVHCLQQLERENSQPTAKFETARGQVRASIKGRPRTVPIHGLDLAMKFPRPFCRVFLEVDGPRDIALASGFFKKLAAHVDGLHVEDDCRDSGGVPALVVSTATVAISLQMQSRHPFIKFLQRKPVSFVKSIVFGEQDRTAAAAAAPWFLLAAKSDIISLTNNPIQSSMTISNMQSPIKSGWIKEIIIPSTEKSQHTYHSSITAHNEFIAISEAPGVYSSSVISPRLDVRLFPALKLGLVLFTSSENIAALLLKGPDKAIALSKLGSRLCSTYQIERMPKCLAQMLCLQLTDSAETPSFYCEGSEAVLDGTILALQSARVVDVGASATLDPKNGTGDCWNEAREIFKSPEKLVR